MQPNVQDKFEQAQVLLCSGCLDEAFSQFEKLVRQNPSQPAMWFAYGSSALRTGRMDVAERAWKKMEQFAPRDHELLLQIGHQYNGCRDHDTALTFYRRASEISAKAINPRISMAVHFEQRHDFKSAREQISNCLDLAPNDEQAKYMSALLDLRENKIAEAETTLRDLLKSEPKHEYVRYASRHELAAICDRTGRYDEAMTLLQEAKRLMRTLLPKVDTIVERYDQVTLEEHAAVRKPKTIVAEWNKAFPQSKRQSVPPLAFLGGHPRSGTTLLEQILDAHPEVAAADEPTTFMTKLMPAYQKVSSYLSVQALNKLRQSYFDDLRKSLKLNGREKVFIDKNPSPTSRLPVWLRVFPELRVIIALRDPRDVLVSCFFQNLPLNTVTVNFLSIERLARHYANLMDIWLAVREWENFSWMETRYEQITRDVESEGKKVMQFLGLSWDDQQAQFHIKSRSKEFHCPSYHDVTKKLHNRSIGRWKHYEKYLAPAFPILDRYLKAFKYD